MAGRRAAPRSGGGDDDRPRVAGVCADDDLVRAGHPRDAVHLVDDHGLGVGAGLDIDRARAGVGEEGDRLLDGLELAARRVRGGEAAVDGIRAPRGRGRVVEIGDGGKVRAGLTAGGDGLDEVLEVTLVGGEVSIREAPCGVGNRLDKPVWPAGSLHGDRHGFPRQEVETGDRDNLTRAVVLSIRCYPRLRPYFGSDGGGGNPRKQDPDAHEDAQARQESTNPVATTAFHARYLFCSVRHSIVRSVIRPRRCPHATSPPGQVRDKQTGEAGAASPSDPPVQVARTCLGPQNVRDTRLQENNPNLARLASVGEPGRGEEQLASQLDRSSRDGMQLR